MANGSLSNALYLVSLGVKCCLKNMSGHHEPLISCSRVAPAPSLPASDAIRNSATGAGCANSVADATSFLTAESNS